MTENSAVIRIRNNSTGEVRQYTDESGGGASAEYQWGEGNYACDCNRHLFFLRAGGDGDDGDDECSQGDYAVVVTDANTGRVLYREFDEDAEVTP